MTHHAYLQERSVSCLMALAFRLSDACWNLWEIDVTSKPPAVFLSSAGCASVFLTEKNHGMPVHLFAMTRKEEVEDGSTGNRTTIRVGIDGEQDTEFGMVTYEHEVADKIDVRRIAHEIWKAIQRIELVED
jgi:hypothetical protein